jgi:hypothetical protein
LVNLAAGFFETRKSFGFWHCRRFKGVGLSGIFYVFDGISIFGLETLIDIFDGFDLEDLNTQSEAFRYRLGVLPELIVMIFHFIINGR